jgi:hypothetical protein
MGLRNIGKYIVWSVVFCSTLSACRKEDVAEKDGGSDVSGVATHRRFFGTGESVASWLFSYQRPGEKDKRCWYYREFPESDPKFSGLSIGQTHYNAMSSAQRLVDFPLEDKHPKEHIAFWAGLESAALVLDYAGGQAACTAAVVSGAALLTPLAPLAFFPAAFTAVGCGLSMYGVSQTKSTLERGASYFDVTATEVLDGSGMSPKAYEQQKMLREAVKAKKNKQLVDDVPCLSADQLLLPFQNMFSRSDLEACARMNSLTERHISLPQWCPSNGYALGVNSGHCSLPGRAPQNGAMVYSNTYLSSSLGYVGKSVKLKILERKEVRNSNSKVSPVVVVKVRRESGYFDAAKTKNEGWMLSGFLDSAQGCK